MALPGADPYVMNVAAMAHSKDTIMNPGCSIQNSFFRMTMSRMVPPPFAVITPETTAASAEYPAASARRVPLIAKTMVDK